MICKNCKKKFEPEIIDNDRGRYAWCPHCHSKHAVRKLRGGECNMFLLIETDAPDSPYK